MGKAQSDGELHLYLAFLGGDPAPGRLSEDHEAVVVVARDLREARKAARSKWGGASKGHVDAIEELSVVDGYRVRIEERPPVTS